MNDASAALRVRNKSGSALIIVGRLPSSRIPFASLTPTPFGPPSLPPFPRITQDIGMIGIRYGWHSRGQKKRTRVHAYSTVHIYSTLPPIRSRIFTVLYVRMWAWSVLERSLPFPSFSHARIGIVPLVARSGIRTRYWALSYIAPTTHRPYSHNLFVSRLAFGIHSMLGRVGEWVCRRKPKSWEDCHRSREVAGAR